MPASSFQFVAALPCEATYREPARELVKSALQYAGYPEPEIAAMLAAIDGAALEPLPAERAVAGPLGIELAAGEDTLAIEISGPHLTRAAPAVAATMTVTGGTRDGQPALTFVQRLPVA